MDSRDVNVTFTKDPLQQVYIEQQQQISKQQRISMQQQ